MTQIIQTRGTRNGIVAGGGAVVPSNETSLDVKSPASELDRGSIAARAYQRYVSRGGADGSPEQDWLEAELELREELRRQASAAGRFA